MRLSHAARRERRRDILADIAAGVAVSAVAQMHGLSERYIRVIAAMGDISPINSRAAAEEALMERARKMQRERKNRREVADALGLDYPKFCRLARLHNIPFDYAGARRDAARQAAHERAAPMAALYADGYTLQQIGDQFAITRERVRQIIAKHYRMNGKSGGKHARAAKLAAEREHRRNEACLLKNGCAWEQYRDLKRMRKPLYAYRQQRRNARDRGIGWELTVWQWWSIWQSSGHWKERGRGQGYCMCRKGDTGPYAVGNVFIALATVNSSDAQRRKRIDQSLPIGVRRTKSGKYLATRCINGQKRQLGTHDTPELAYAAYLRAAPQTSAAA